ncbi:MAG: DUF58 domain-containing protein [Turicibacter sp.]|nr:DUF58 domain-containing protein [Turicibacter sp.]
MLVAVVIAMCIVAYFFDKYTVKHAFSGIGYNISPDVRLAEPGEEFTITTTITNGKPLPIMFLSSTEIFPKDIKLVGDFEVITYHYGMAQTYSMLISTAYVMPRQKLTRKLKATLSNRGRYFFRGAELKVGSFLGISEERKDFTFFNELVIPPKPSEVPELKTMLGSFMGDVSVNRFIIEDPVLTIGFREYTGNEPMRHISWKQTAKYAQTMVKKHDYTIDPAVTVVLNTEDIPTEDEFETLLSMTRTVCEFLENCKTPYMFITNSGTVEYSRQRVVLQDGLGYAHIFSVLETLGRAIYSSVESAEELFTNAIQKLEQGRAYIILTPKSTAPNNLFLRKLQAKTGIDPLILTPN